MEAYCVKCKAKREMEDAKETSFKAKGGKTRKATPPASSFQTDNDWYEPYTRRCHVISQTFAQILPQSTILRFRGRANDYIRRHGAESKSGRWHPKAVSPPTPPGQPPDAGFQYANRSGIPSQSVGRCHER